jgi:hypothetical protein
MIPVNNFLHFIATLRNLLVISNAASIAIDFHAGCFWHKSYQKGGATHGVCDHFLGFLSPVCRFTRGQISPFLGSICSPLIFGSIPPER